MLALGADSPALATLQPSTPAAYHQHPVSRHGGQHHGMTTPTTAEYTTTAASTVVILADPARPASGSASGSSTPERGRQLAWLTEDILKPSTRSGGMAERVK
jgi:hypothetical protein